jgi:hypothetical protein
MKRQGNSWNDAKQRRKHEEEEREKKKKNIRIFGLFTQ